MLETSRFTRIEIRGPFNNLHFFSVYADYEKLPVGRLEINRDGYITGLFVLDRYQKQGLGRQLVEKAIEFAKERHLDQVYLHCWPNIVEFYLKLGFEVCDEKSGHFGVKMVYLLE